MAHVVEFILIEHTRTYLSYIVSIVTADNMMMQGARVSALMVLILFSENTLVSVPEGLTPWGGKGNRF